MRLRLALVTSTLLVLALVASAVLQQDRSNALQESPPSADEFGTAFFIFDPQDEVFYTQGPDMMVAINAQGVTLLRSDETLHVEFVGANLNAKPTGGTRQPGVANLYNGNNPSLWREHLPIFADLIFQDLYPGISLHYSLVKGGLKSEFVLEPNADPGEIAIRYRGIAGLDLDAKGNLEITGKITDTVAIIEEAPIVFQPLGHTRHPLRAAFRLLDKDTYGFTLLDAPDPTLPVVIDPLLIYSSYLGGVWEDEAWAVALDPEDNLLITGITWSYSFPPEVNPDRRPQKKIFVAKLTATGELRYVTFLGGTTNVLGEDSSEEGNAIGTDLDGNTYVSGETFSVDFPVLNAWQPLFGGDEDAYLLKLTPMGTLAYSTFLGGSESEEVNDIHVTDDGTVYLGGEVYSDDFPLMNPWQSQTFGWEDEDAFISIFNPQGNLIYSTYFGSNARDQVFRIAVDAAGVIYASGMTSSASGFPLVNPVQTVYGGEWDDAFVLKLNPWTNQLLFSTYLGGAGRDEAWGIDIDIDGNIHVAGSTNSYNFPLQAPLQPEYGGGTWDVFVAKIDGTTYQLLYSTYLGGTGYDFAWGLKLDSGGNIYAVGETESPNFPTQTPLQGTLNGTRDAFLVQLDPAGTLSYASYLGGDDVERGFRLTTRADWVVTVVGETRSSDFPLQSAQQDFLNGPRDGFVAQFSIVTPTATPTPTPTPTPGPVSAVIGLDGGTLVHEYPRHVTQLTIPAGVLSASTTFTISYLSFPPMLSPLDGMDHFFEVQMNVAPEPFSPPLELLMRYSSTHIISGTLGLHRLEAGEWITDGITITQQSVGQMLASIRDIGIFGLLGETNRLYLPLTLRNH